MKMPSLFLRAVVMAVGVAFATVALADVDELNLQVFRLYQQGKYGEAIPMAQQVLAEVEITFGPDHPETATGLNNLAVLYQAMGRYDEALPLYRRTLAVWEKALGPDHPNTATSLNNLAVLYRVMGRYDEALPLFQRTLTISEKALMLDHPDTGARLSNLAELYRAMGRYDEAFPLSQRALAILEKALGPDHPDTATGLSNLALLYQATGRYDEALPLYQRALAIWEKALGPDHRDTATGLTNQASLYQATGRYDKALPLYQRALAIWEKALEPGHTDTATGLNNLANLYREMGRYDEALPFSQRALAILEKAQGPGHTVTATAVNNLANLYREMGRYDEALPLYQRALAIDEKAIGLDHPDTAVDLNNLAGLYREMGRYDEALPLSQRALAILEKALGPGHTDTATGLNNLANLYREMGRYDEALPLSQRALAILEKAQGPGHTVTATALNNLANLYREMGRYDEALPLYQRALAIDEKAIGLDHPGTAVDLNNLAGLYESMGQYDKALPLHQRALAIREKALGPDHPDTAAGMNNLAGLCESMGSYNEALPLYQRALAIREKALGPDHPETATGLNNLAVLYQAMGRHDKALPLYRRAVRGVAVTDISDLKRNHGAINHLAVFSANLAQLLARQEDEGQIDEAIFYYKLSVNTRQRMRAGTRRLDAAMRESFTRQVAEPYKELAELLIRRGRIAEAERVLLLLKEEDLLEYVRRNGSDASAQPGLQWSAEEEAFRQALENVAARWRAFELRRRQLMDEVKSGTRAPDDPDVLQFDAQRVQLETATGNAMAEAGRHFSQAAQAAHESRQKAFGVARTELATKLAEMRERGDGKWRTVGLALLPSERGLSLIVTTEQGAVPLMIKVSEKELNEQVSALRAAISDRKDYQTAAKALYGYLIAPAEAQLGSQAGIDQWAILAYGSLSEVPFAALQRSDGSHLIEHYALTMLTADGSGRLEGLETPPRTTWQGVALGASRADPDFGSQPLPGVTREVCGVIRAASGQGCRPDEGQIGGQRYLDERFTPEVLQGLLGSASGGASLLHIATHFKLEKSLMLLGDGSKLSTADILKWTPRLGQYDLVVLSACDSGVSESGVESLGGMFRSKGAKAVLATLWPVADVGAAPLMVEFYRQRGEKQAMSKSAALREAQLAMLKGTIQDDIGKVDLRHPYFWAPYVLMGNWL